MTSIFIKYFFIIICALYCYIKLLNYKNIFFTKTFYIFLFALVLSFSMTFFRIQFIQISILPMIIACLVFMKILTKIKVKIVINTILISFGISYFSYSVSVIFTTLIVHVCFRVQDLSFLSFLFSSLVQASLTFYLFKIKRLRNGFPYLLKKEFDGVSAFLSSILLCMIVILSFPHDGSPIYIVPTALLFFSSIGIFIWWKRSITKAYIEKLRLKEFEELKNEISNLQFQINQLNKHNDCLARIIHKDNKIIPSLDFAVKNFLSNVSLLNDNQIKIKGSEILKLLDNVTKERSGLISNYQISTKKLPLTNIFSLDTLINYMFNKAKSKKIDLEFIINGNIKYMINNLICENDLITLLGDLIENAIIATDKCENKKILVSLGEDNNYYKIIVEDSADNFDIDVICNLGLKKITTHSNEGGSGIGLFSAFEIIKKVNASFILDEYPFPKLKMVKKIEILFDDQKKYIVKSSRTHKIKERTNRDDIEFIK